MSKSNHIKTTVEGVVGPEKAQAKLQDVDAVDALYADLRRHIYRQSDAGKMPAPVKVVKLDRWSRQDIMNWITAGCSTVRTTEGNAGKMPVPVEIGKLARLRRQDIMDWVTAGCSAVQTVKRKGETHV